MSHYGPNLEKKVQFPTLEPNPVDDPVNHPDHYTSGGIETIDFIRCKKLNYLAGNVIKYIVRHKIKENPLQDLKKARFYIERMIQEEEENATVLP